MSESGSPNNTEDEGEEQRPLPSTCLASGEWPDGPLKANAPPEAELIRQICQTLKRARDVQGISNRGLARLSGIGQPTLQDLLSGRTWGSLRTIAALEEALGVGLWPAERPLLKPSPRYYLTPPSSTCPNGGKWPGGPFESDPPPELALARMISAGVERAVDAKPNVTLASAAEAAGLPLVVVRELVNGDRWPDLSTISRLEMVLNTMLWRRVRPARPQ